MKLRETLQKRFLAPVIGLLFAFFLCFVNSGPVSAAPETSTPVNEETCYDQVKGIGWLVCPTTGVLAQAVDSIYNIIDDLLVVQPMTTDTESPVFTVWEYVRDLTNIVFVILIIVVIYSQITGLGFDNYNIKKILPKLIITAILINLSYLICSALVDVSNIAGISLRGFFEGIESNLNASGDALVTWGGLAAVLAGGGAVAGFAISASGGLAAFIWMLLPAVLSAALAVAVGLITIAMRQAVVALLVMIAPLAFVCYMLPNTNKWFTKWKDILVSMLVFFPMFSALFGASHLAGWALIVKAQQDGSYFTLILGMAVQVIPLFLSVSLMKMSGSILGTVSNKLSNLTSGLNNKARTAASARRDAARARKLAEASTKNFNPVSGASWAAYLRRQQALREASRAANEDTINSANALHVNARRTGRRISGWGKDGRAIYEASLMRDEDGNIMRDEKGRALTTDLVRANRDMVEEYRNRELKLAGDADKIRTDNAMGNIDPYLRSASVEQNRHRSNLETRAKGQAQNYLDLRTQQSAKSRNDRSDQRFYFEQVRQASKLNENSQKYQNLIRAGAGADAYDEDATIQQNALTTVTADAYEAYEKERAVTSQRYSTLFDKQVTKDVLSQYKKALRSANIDAVTAAQNTLAKRGDYDKVSENLRNFMDQTGEFADLGDAKRLRLGSDFANTLALNLLGMKDSDPLLGRLGKAINMETWRYTSKNAGEDGARQTDVMTFHDYIFGDQDGGNNQARTSAFELMKGTSIKGADRTFFGDMKDTAKAYNFTEEQFNSLIGGMMPQFISAIPTYESSGEQIINSMQLLTGLSNKGGKWHVDYNEKTKQTEPIHMAMINKYLGGLTDKDLNVFKTDAYQAILEAIAQNMKDKKTGQPMTCYGVAEDNSFGFYPPEAVYEEFRKMISPNMIENLRNNLAQGTNSGMKDSVQIALGLAEPAPGKRRKKDT